MGADQKKGGILEYLGIILYLLGFFYSETFYLNSKLVAPCFFFFSNLRISYSFFPCSPFFSFFLFDHHTQQGARYKYT